MDLALAAPDKEDVAGVWTYRVAALKQLNVPIQTGVEPTVERIRAFDPDLIVIATGGVPRQINSVQRSISGSSCCNSGAASFGSRSIWTDSTSRCSVDAYRPE